MKTRELSKKKKNPSFSIKTKVTLLCAVFILIATSINYFLIHSVSKTTIMTNTEMTMTDLAAAYGKNVSDAIDSISESTNFLMQSDGLISFMNSEGTENKDEVENFINMFLNMNSTHEDISLVNKDGIILYSSNTALMGKDLSAETYFTKTMSNGTSSQSDVFISETTGEPCVIFSIPLVKNIHTDTMDNMAIGNGIPNEQALNGQSSPGQPTKDQTSNNMTIDSQDFLGAITVTVQVSELSKILSNISVTGQESGYAYLIDSKGTVVYHPDEEVIGTKLNIPAIDNLVNEIQNGTLPETNVISYTYKGEKMYAGYSIDAKNQWILLINVNQDEILSPLNQATFKSLSISIILMLLLSVLSYVFAGTITRPITKLTKFINRTADLDFSNDPSNNFTSYASDETGEMSRAIVKMRAILQSMIVKIGEASSNILTSADNLNGITTSVNDYASDNSATAEELSASMEETAATTDIICNNINNIESHSKEIYQNATKGMQYSEKLIESATALRQSTNEATDKTKQIYEQVKDNTNLAIQKAKSVEKINNLTNVIKEISNQTSLLALNASIEAARAGDAGRGFSVVASEIGALADQSSKTVANINDIIIEVNQSVSSLTDSLEQSLDFLENNVLSDYNTFLQASEQYNSNAGDINQILEGIHHGINSLNDDLLHINTSITEINTMINESSNSVSDVAERNTDIVGLTVSTRNMVMGNKEYASELDEIVKKFKL